MAGKLAEYALRVKGAEISAVIVQKELGIGRERPGA